MYQLKILSFLTFKALVKSKNAVLPGLMILAWTVKNRIGAHQFHCFEKVVNSTGTIQQMSKTCNFHGSNNWCWHWLVWSLTKHFILNINVVKSCQQVATILWIHFCEISLQQPQFCCRHFCYQNQFLELLNIFWKVGFLPSSYCVDHLVCLQVFSVWPNLLVKTWHVLHHFNFKTNIRISAVWHYMHSILMIQQSALETLDKATLIDW